MPSLICTDGRQGKKYHWVDRFFNKDMRGKDWEVLRVGKEHVAMMSGGDSKRKAMGDEEEESDEKKTKKSKGA